MKSFALAFMIFALGVVLALPQFTDTQVPAALSANLPFVLMVLGFFLQLDALAMLRGNLSNEKDLQQRKAHDAVRINEHAQQVAVLEEAKQQYKVAAEHAQNELAAAKNALVEMQVSLRSAEKNLNAEKAALAAEKNKQLQASSQDEQSKAVQLLALLQEKGRLVDFLMEDASPHSDDALGRAARFVHRGCSEVLAEFFTIKPLRAEDEGAKVVLADAELPSHKLLGHVGEAPYAGTLLHRGWVTEKVTLPQLLKGSSVAAHVIAPAEVEL